MVKTVGTLAVSILLSSLCVSGAVAEQAQFVASESCELYQSRRKLTNPQSLTTQSNAEYTVADKATDADGVAWFYVNVKQGKSQKRWVKAACGSLAGEPIAKSTKEKSPEAAQKNQGQSLSSLARALLGGAELGGAESSAKASTGVSASAKESVRSGQEPAVKAAAYAPVRGVTGSCSTAGAFDSNLLALSWQATYCETRGHIKECKLAKRAAQKQQQQFSLHGLWPNKRSCGVDYGYCGAVKRRPSGSFCNYPSFTVDKALVPRMADAMPSMAAGGCLHRHEWWKHGSGAGSSATDFYTIAIDFLDEVNEASFVQDFVSKNVGKKVQRSAFISAFEASFGRGSAKKMSLHCDGNKLKEIRLSLPGAVTSATSLKSQLSKAANTGSGNCRSSFEIDAY